MLWLELSVLSRELGEISAPNVDFSGSQGGWSGAAWVCARCQSEQTHRSIPG